jgi:hypothetical protein
MEESPIFKKIEKPNKKTIFNTEEIKEFHNLIEGRDIVQTKEVLSEIIKSTEETNLKEVSLLLASNEKLINNSTIARGDTFNGQGIGQAILRGSIEEPIVQVAIIKGYNEPINPIKNEWEFIPLENNKEDYNRTVLHELLHSFTRYIISFSETGKSELLRDYEKDFYTNIVNLHKKFLEKNKTGDQYLDKLDEYIVKSLTSNLSNNGQYNIEQYISVLNEFKKFYLRNDRNIKSISVKLSNK